MQIIIGYRPFVLCFLFLSIVFFLSTHWNSAQDFSENSSGKSKVNSASTKTIKRSRSMPTFNKEVVRIFQKHCQTCHRPGGIAPFSLMTYKDARPWAAAIREQVILKKMPPWKPAPGCGDFHDAGGLTKKEINALVAWVDIGAPQGNASDLPAPIEFPDRWPLGPPDLIAQSDVDYAPPTQGDMYRCFSVPISDLRSDRWLRAVSVKPGNAKIVHHVVVHSDPGGKSAALDAKDPGPGYTCFGGPKIGGISILGGWAPGIGSNFAPEGAGIKLKNNSRVVIQVHYHPTNQTEIDRTSVGFYFSKTPVQRQLRYLEVKNTTFVIPPGAKNYEVTASKTTPDQSAGKIWSVAPHMHFLGRRIKVELTKLGATTPDCLINIPDWDFNWQGIYLYKKPIGFAGGSELIVTCNFDNSTDNPRNPNNPPKTVSWGPETTDEMVLVTIGFTLDQQLLPLSSPTLSEVVVDSLGNLVASGNGFLNGADIEINERSLRDTTPAQGNKLLSSELWRNYAAHGQEVSVTVLNPDGVRTPALKFTRLESARSVDAASAASFPAKAQALDTSRDKDISLLRIFDWSLVMLMLCASCWVRCITVVTLILRALERARAQPVFDRNP
jgi:hypothetical protein